MLPLTLSIPKPLLRIGNKTIIDYIFDAFPAEIDEVIIVVGYLKKKILEHLGAKYQGRPIRYVTQTVLDGSATALLVTSSLFLPKERFLIVYGDELPVGKEIELCLAHKYSWLCCPNDKPQQSGIATIDGAGRIIEVIEKPDNPASNMSAAGIMVVDGDIFNYSPVAHANGEYYLTSLMDQFLKEHPVQAVVSHPRPPFISPDELQKIKILEDGRPIIL